MNEQWYMSEPKNRWDCLCKIAALAFVVYIAEPISIMFSTNPYTNREHPFLTNLGVLIISSSVLFGLWYVMKNYCATS